MKKLKILFVVESFGGGVFSYLNELSNELIHNYDITIAYSLRSETPENFKDYFSPCINFVSLCNFGREINPIKEIKAMRELREIVNDTKPDIIHLHSSKAGAVGRLALRKTDIPLFYTPHSYSFTMSNLNYIKKAIYKLIEKICATSNSTTISCSYSEHLETQKLTKNAVYVNNGICINKLRDKIESISEKQNDDTLTVYTLGRICKQKNPALFNQIAKRLPDIKFIWIGDGDMKGELHSKNIECTGWVTREKALEIATESNVFIMTSVSEGLSISLLESMYMKKLCVVSDVCGNRDVIKDKENGYLCSSIEDFVNVISALKENLYSENNIAIREKAHNEVEAVYNMDVVANKYSMLYSGEKLKVNA